MKLRNDLDIHNALRQWHWKFAWAPTRLINGDVVWLQWVQRRYKDGYVHTDFDGVIRTWEYRA